MIPKRALGALVTTAFALVLLFSFKTPGGETLAGASGSGVAIVGAPPTSTPGTGSGSTSGSTTTTGSTATATPAPTATSGAKTAVYRDGTVQGSVVSTRYGDVQVQVTISGGAITDVAPLQLPSSDGRSQRIASQAAPILRQEALTAQSAKIELLSGATYTSDAYARSLQSALDSAKA
ncbi:MAG: FMN-binding protein [Chloroflexota bacterium]